MNKELILAPSLLAADFSKVGAQLAEIKAGGAKYIHLDVMDGIFVPNISFGVPVIKSLRKSSDLFFDTHLMIVQPERYIDAFVDAGSDLITFHFEACDDPAACLRQIRARGIKAAISVKPGTSVDVLRDLLPLCDMVLVMTVEPGFGGQKFMADMMEKVKKLALWRKQAGLSFDIEVDGGVGVDNARLCVESGANILVAGSSVLGKPSVKEAAEAVLQAANA